MDYRSADSITSWFVRSRKPLPDQEEGREQKDQQGGSKQHKGAAAEKKANPVVAAAKAVANAAAEKKAAGVAAAAEKKAGAAAAAADKQAATALAAAEDKKAGAAAAAEAKKVTGAAAAAADKKAAGAAAAAAAAIKKAAGSGGTGDKKPAAAAEKKAAAAAAADTAKGRRAGPGSSSSSETDSDDERERQHAERQRAAEQLKAQKKKAAEERQARDEEAEYRPRIMAYSDSDSDVESHFTRVKTHLLPPSEEKTAERAAAAEAAAAAAAAAAQQAAAIEAALAQRTASRRLSTALAAAGRAAAPHMTAGLAGRATGLLVLGRLYPRATHVAGLVSMAVPLASTAALRAGLDLPASLPAPLLQAATEMGQLGKAAAAVAASRILLAGLRQRQRRRLERQQRRSQQQPPAEKSGQTEDAATGTAEVEGEVQEAAVASGRLLRRKSSVNLAALGLCADLGAAIERRQPESAADWAAVYAAEMREMRRMLQENEVELPPNRFDASNAELMRYARACGLISAKTPEQRAAALEAGVSRVVHTSEWVARQRWMSDRELRRWERLVAWKAHDSSGRPILLARLGRAQQLVKPERCEDMATALLTLVHRGLSTQLSNTAGPAEQMVVVLDCRGGSSMGLGRHMGLLKKLAVTLNQHYPDRLYRLHLLELPLLLRWVMHGITPLLHPNTRSKVVFSSMTDPGLPVTVAHLSKTRSALKPFSLKRSLSNCSFPSSGDATPALRSPQHTPALGSLGPAVSAAAIQLGSLEAACSGGGAAGGGCSVASTPRQQQQQPEEQPLGEEDMPTTPPPTLKVPQSPREGCKPRGQAQARSLARQLSMSDEQQQEQQQLLGLVPPSPFGSSLGLDLQQRPQLQLQAAAQQQQQQQPLPVPLSGSQAGAALNPAAAPGSTAESASAGVVSHAVPWSPGAQSPASSLSRVSSYHSDGIGGEEPVAAAPAKAAADAAKELEEWRLRRQAAATAELRASLDLGSSGSQAGGSQRMLRVESADSLRSLAVLPAPPAVAAPAPASAPAPPPAVGSTGSGGKLAGWLGALLPAGDPQGDPSQQQLPPRGRRPSVGRLALGGVLGGSFASSAPSTALGGRLRKGGLVELPDRQLRLLSNPGRGPAPRKSSLRRSESADPLPASRRQLGSHPLRRQSSVSWAEELESVKEIMPRQLSPRQVARARMTAAVVAAAAQPQLVLVACMSLLVLVALLQRALLSLALAA